MYICSHKQQKLIIMRHYIATTEKRDQNILTRVKNKPLDVWKKLREQFGNCFTVDTYYNKVRVRTFNKDVLAFFDNPYKVTTFNEQITIIL